MKLSTLITLFLLSASAIFAGPNMKFIYHTVEKGETLYSISRQYSLKPAELAQYNDAIGEKLTIKIGQKLKVPAPDAGSNEKESETPQPASQPATTEKPVWNPSSAENIHIVKKGDTFYSIAREYNMSRTDLQSINDLEDMNLKIGQKLIIKKGASVNKDEIKASEAPAAAQASVSKSDVEKAMKKDGYTWTLPKVTEPNATNVSTATGDATASSVAVGLASTKTYKSWKSESTSEKMEIYKPKAAYDPSSEYESLYYQNVYSGLTKKSETGVVKLLTDNNNTAHIAYYNNASVGTILKLTNPDNGKTTYAIVVGKLPPAESNSYLLKLSDRVARNLSVKDYTSVEVVCYTGN